MADIVHVNPKGSWKKVKIDPNRFPKADLEGLISLEELTDYDIVKITAESGTETSLKVCNLIYNRRFVHCLGLFGALHTKIII